jgi:hypothetical protein
MRSKFLTCAALAAAACSLFCTAAFAADKKDKAASAKKKPAELLTDERAMKKQLQWEDKVMGPDVKRDELAKIARANAIVQAAAQKAERDRELEAAAPAPRPTKQSAKKSELTLPTTAEERSLRDGGDKSHVPISAKLATDEAAAAPPPSKPADDKFIDKLLKDEQVSHKRKSTSDDRELDNLLAGAQDKPTHRGKRTDKVDDILSSADKGPAMPAPRSQASLPEWTKQPDIVTAPASPPPAPVAVKPAARPAGKDDGVIHVVQGAAAGAPARAAVVASKSRRPGPAGKAVQWNDPFAEKETVASRDLDNKRDQAPKKEAAARSAGDGTWRDPFADAPQRKSARSTTPTTSAPASPTKGSTNGSTNGSTRRGEKSADPAARGPGWKDPFTKAPSEPSRAPVAMRELGKSESSKWEIAARRPSAHAASTTEARVGWAILKKRAR